MGGAPMHHCPNKLSDAPSASTKVSWLMQNKMKRTVTLGQINRIVIIINRISLYHIFIVSNLILFLNDVINYLKLFFNFI